MGKKVLMSIIMISLLAFSTAIWAYLYKEFKKANRVSITSQQNQKLPTNNTDSTQEKSSEQNTAEREVIELDSSDDKTIENTIENTSNMYYVDEPKIMEAIQYGKDNDVFQFFTLPVKSRSLDDRTIEYVAINTPFQAVALLSHLSYTKEDRTISLEEANDVIEYDKLI